MATSDKLSHFDLCRLSNMVDPISMPWFISVAVKVSPWTSYASSTKELDTNVNLGAPTPTHWVKTSGGEPSPPDDSDAGSGRRSAWLD